MIVLEGPDAAGKSTLARQLASRHGLQQAPKEHVSIPNDDQVRARTWSGLADVVRSNTPVKIYDRFFLSELCYGGILRDRVCFSPDQQLKIFKLIESLEIPIIICLPPFTNIVNEVVNSPQAEGITDHITDIYEWYRDLFISAPFRLNRHIYDFTTQDHTVLDDPIERYVNQRRARAW